MRKAFIGVANLAIVAAVLQTWAQAPQGKYSDPSQFHLAKPGVPIAGILVEEAQKITERHYEELRQLPGVVSISFMAEGLVVETANPSALPAAVEGLPVFAIPPVDPRAAGGLDYALSNPPKTKPTPLPEPPVATEPPPPECPPGASREGGVGRCVRVNPPTVPQETPARLPPPPGVIVLKPGKVREQADSCPDGFLEVKGQNNWRFCVDRNNPEIIPPLWAPPIAGVPYEQAQEIVERHTNELLQLPGVDAVGLGADGIHVYTSQPELVPKQLEGLPINPLPPQGPGQLLSHTLFNGKRPLHGALGFRSTSLTGGLTLTGIVLAAGILGRHPPSSMDSPL